MVSRIGSTPANRSRPSELGKRVAERSAPCFRRDVHARMEGISTLRSWLESTQRGFATLAPRTAHSSSGLGHRPLTAAARVRIPYGPLVLKR